MIRLWTEKEVTHHGRYFQVTEARPTARPYQQPHPKIWLAAMSDPAVRRVGKEGHIMYVGPAQPFETIRRQIDLYHQALEEFGHSTPEEMVLVREFFCGNSREDAMKQAQRGFETKYQVYSQHGFQGTDEVLTSKITGDLETLMDDTFIVGAPEDFAEQIGRYRDLGFTHIFIRLFYPGMSQQEVLEHIDLVGSGVLPAVQQL